MTVFIHLPPSTDLTTNITYFFVTAQTGFLETHYSDVIMGAKASQITSISIVYSIVCSGTDQRKLQKSASLAFVRGIHRWPVNSPHNGPVTRKMFPFDDVIMMMHTPRCDMFCSACCGFISLILKLHEQKLLEGVVWWINFFEHFVYIMSNITQLFDVTFND